MPLPLTAFPSFHECRRTVHRNGHVEVDRAYYAVPSECLARQVWVRWDGRLVRIYNNQMAESLSIPSKSRAASAPRNSSSHRRKSAGSNAAPPGFWPR